MSIVDDFTSRPWENFNCCNSIKTSEYGEEYNILDAGRGTAGIYCSIVTEFGFVYFAFLFVIFHFIFHCELTIPLHIAYPYKVSDPEYGEEYI